MLSVGFVANVGSKYTDKIIMIFHKNAVLSIRLDILQIASLVQQPSGLTEGTKIV